MPDPQALVQQREQLTDFRAAFLGHAEIECGRKRQRVRVVAPEKAERVVAPGARDRDADLVLAVALERPFVSGDDPLEEIDRFAPGSSLSS